MDQQAIARAAALLRQSRDAAALTGAGIGRPSGIPDFRSESGLWSQDDPMEAASLRTFRTNPQRFYDWLRPLMDTMLAAQPNPAHLALAELEQHGPLRAVVTQNIDSMHQRSGSRTVYEVHGNISSATCPTCHTSTPAEPHIATIRRGDLPRCPTCDSVLKPDITLFGEALPEQTIQQAVATMVQCDLLLVAGTSLEVHPAGGLPMFALEHGARVIIVNLSKTYLDSYADVVLAADVAQALPAIVAAYRDGQETL